MNKLSKNNIYVLETFESGYDINEKGELIRKNKSIISKFRVNKNGYFVITLRLPTNNRANVSIHRLQAYKKFGSRIFEKGIMVRHIDNNSLNNFWDNIEIGSNSDNQMDRNPDCRKKSAIIASRKMQDGCRTYEDRCLIYEDLKNNVPYSKIMKKHNVSSKGTLSFIKNKSLEYKEYVKNIST